MKIHEKWLVEGTSKPQKTSLHPRMTEAKSPVLGRASPYSRMWLTAVEVVDSSDFFFSIENSHGARTLLTISPLPRANSFSSSHLLGIGSEWKYKSRSDSVESAVGIWSTKACNWSVERSTVRVRVDSNRDRRSKATVCTDQLRGWDMTRATYGDICSFVSPWAGDVFFTLRHRDSNMH